jgi:hypothetical protein
MKIKKDYKSIFLNIENIMILDWMQLGEISWGGNVYVTLKRGTLHSQNMRHFSS